MKVEIELPSEFEKHFESDKFKDSFERLKADCDHCRGLSGNLEKELCAMLISAFQNAKILS